MCEMLCVLRMFVYVFVYMFVSPPTDARARSQTQD
jgi:hypothetical protein